jgi:hypothetical protein
MGDLDVWTFTATAGERMSVHVGQITDTSGTFQPWIRLWSPTGASLGDTSGAGAAVIDDIVAATTGTYLVLVGSFDSGLDGTGTYRVTMAHTPGPITVSPGDEGGPLINGATHTGQIDTGDLDVWTFTATAGDRITVHLGETSSPGGSGFQPWVRLWSPAGGTLGDTSGALATAIDDIVAPVTGQYLVLIGTFDSGLDATGTYQLTMAHTPGPITVSPGDDGGPIENGEIVTGAINSGDLDVWTFTATAGDRIAVHIGEIADASGTFQPWIRLWTPAGGTLGDTSGALATAIDDAVAPVTGTYLVLVATFDSGLDANGTYRLNMTHTPGPVTVSAGDEGGPITIGAVTPGTIIQGDVDVWTFTATAGTAITVQITETADVDGFQPWIRLWTPAGGTLGDISGVATAAINSVVAPVTGTYLVLVGSFDSGLDGEGSYNLTVTGPSGAPAAQSVSEESASTPTSGSNTGRGRRAR